jgi:diadenosine tetraphosphate (Ap4A) HIT family hydrolase
VHIVARYLDDGAWPRPVWGAQLTRHYVDDVLAATVTELRELLEIDGLDPA